MNPEQINIAIAEHCGWVPQLWAEGTRTRWVKNPGTDQVQYAYRFEDGDDRQLPNYNGDLNAMHSVLVKQVPDTQWDDFSDCLEEFMPAGLRPQPRRKWAMLASAEALAKAFLKWKEGA